MHVCHIIESSGGGSGQVVIDLLKETLDKGNKLTLVYSPVRAEEHFLKEVAALEKKGLRVFSLPMQRKVGPHDAADAWKLYRLLKKTGPYDIIHSHSSKAGALARAAGVFLPSAKQVYTPHAFMTLSPGASRIYGTIEKALSWFGNAIICVSALEERHARNDLKISPDRLHLVPNGITLEHPATRAAAREAMGFKDGDFVAGFIGRLAEQKNPMRLIKAAAQVPGLHLAIIGDGPLKEEAESYIAKENLGDRIHMLGRRNGREMMPGFDWFACGSDYEAFPIVFLEALAAGVPIVSTPVGGAEDAIGRNEAGILLKDFEVATLAKGLAAAAALKPAERDAFRKAARSRADGFSVAHMARKTQNVYEGILAREKKARLEPAIT